MSTTTQASIVDYSAGTVTEDVTQTVVLSLETSRSKNKRVRKGIEEFQNIASYIGETIPSVPENERQPHNNTFYRLVTAEFDDLFVKARVAREAGQYAVSVYNTYAANGKEGDRPSLGHGDFLKISHQDFKIEENDAGYGLKAGFIPYEPLWFAIDTSPYSREYLERIFEGDADTGSCELHLSGDGNLRAHLAVKWPVEVYEPTDVGTKIGVDIGENVIYSVAAVEGDEVLDVELESGSEFRHRREQFKQKRKRFQEQGDLRALKQTRGEHERYTEHVLDTASRRIVEFAREYSPSVIVLENLTHYRDRDGYAIHDWPYAMLQEKIAYKATEEGIPVEKVDPYNTSITCRKCGQATAEFRNGSDFHCRRCGYEVHADVNAAINIANRYE